MPMQLTISRNRKCSENYNSEGHGVSLTVEVDQTLLTRPKELQRQIDELYREADEALDRQLGVQLTPRKTNTPRNHNNPRNQNSRTSPKTSGANSGGSSGSGVMTQSQRRAVESIGKRLGLDVHDEAQQVFGLDLERMSVREASKMIDHLKSLQNNGANR